MASPGSRFDTRLVQTAVFGHARADEPATMPFDYDDALRFKLANGSRGLWCGEWLGGCGQQLSAKLYKDRDCHFAHFPSKDPSRPTCTRRNAGIDSADHLYIHRSLSGLTGIGRQTKKDGTFDGRLRDGICTDLTVWPTEVGNRLLQVQLINLALNDWLAAERGFIDRGQQVDWLFGTRAERTARHQIERSGYAFQIRCEQDGFNRVVLVGTESRGGKLVWNSADECRYTSDGLWTPALRRAVTISKRQRQRASQQGVAQKQPGNLPERTDHPIDVDHITVRLLGAGVRRVRGTPGSGRRYGLRANLTDDRTGWETEAELQFKAPPERIRLKYAYRLVGPATGNEPWGSTTAGLVITAKGICRGRFSLPSSSEAPVMPLSQLEKPHRADHEGIRRAFGSLRVRLYAAAKRGDVRQVGDLIDEARELVPRNVLFRAQHAELDAAEAWVRERIPSGSPGKKIANRRKGGNAEVLDALLAFMRSAKKRNDERAMRRLLGRARALINQAPPETFPSEERKLVHFEEWIAARRSKAK
ncbi:hypothetical protein [Nonomuraea glycinis]|uniref:hypothetical protein n=1 Tax=Nonomuraea glycinis TaxID=2047744 RepID=UPI002E155D9D|nr:hypothetical protein OHA68_17560 [Nonomuraea glycinis]